MGFNGVCVISCLIKVDRLILRNRFVPYLLAVFLIAIPALILEISIGQAYRGGSVIAFNNINRRLKGVGLGSVFVSFVVVQYFTVNLAWIMIYFRNSFSSPLPWEGRINEFYNRDVVANVDPIPGSLMPDNSNVAAYTEYPGVALIGETVGWSAFVWFLIFISIFKGVGLTGRVVYFTMGLPVITTIIFVGRAVSLDNAGEGIRLLWATWRGSQLADGTVWQTAVGQVFFSTGVGFGVGVIRFFAVTPANLTLVLYILCVLQPETFQCCHGLHPDLRI